MKTLTTALCSLLFASSLVARTWTSSDGKPLEAEFISATETEITLKRDSDGKTFTIPLSKLSDSDQEFAKEQESAPEESATNDPAPIEGEFAHLITGDWVLAEHGKLPYAFYGCKELDGSQKYPLIINLHGKSENNENGKQIGQAKTFIKADNYEKRPCLILAPLCYQPYGATGGGWNDAPGEETLDLLDELIKGLPLIDTNRIYVVGYSMGGAGAWHFLKEEPRTFAAGIPVAGYASGVGKLRSMPIWSFHGAKDEVVPVQGARDCAEELKRSKVFQYTEFPDEGHSIPGRVLKDEKVHEWLFAQQKK